MLELLILGGHEAKRRPLPDGRTLVVGRETTCDVVLNEPSASRRHCSLRVNAGQLIVDDLGSGNGTRVDGAPIKSETTVSSKQLITIGRTRLWCGKATEIPATWQLIGVSEVVAGVRVALVAGETFVVGRDKRSGLSIENPSVSKRHAVLTVGAGRIELLDQSSTGTFVRGDKVSQGGVEHGDELAFGPCVFRVERLPVEAPTLMPEEDEAPAPTLARLADTADEEDAGRVFIERPMKMAKEEIVDLTSPQYADDPLEDTVPQKKSAPRPAASKRRPADSRRLGQQSRRQPGGAPGGRSGRSRRQKKPEIPTKTKVIGFGLFALVFGALDFAIITYEGNAKVAYQQVFEQDPNFSKDEWRKARRLDVVRNYPFSLTACKARRMLARSTPRSEPAPSTASPTALILACIALALAGVLFSRHHRGVGDPAQILLLVTAVYAGVQLCRAFALREAGRNLAQYGWFEELEVVIAGGLVLATFCLFFWRGIFGTGEEHTEGEGDDR